jgi:voltage-gated sodium channel
LKLEGVDREADAADKGTLTYRARQMRHKYMSMPSEELRLRCDERCLDHAKCYDRRSVIALLEQDDNEKEDFWVRSRPFETFWTVMIICNALSIAIQLDSPGLLSPGTWIYINISWFSLFLSEAVIKATVLGWKKYINDPWHQFDVVVLAIVGFQLAATYSVFLADSRLYNTYSRYVASDFVQIIRICRLFRLANYFKELGVLVQSFFSSIRALGWILVLLFIWFYITACIATIFIGRRDFLPSEDEHDIKDLREKFSSIPMSMFALFEVMTLEGWVDYVRPLLKTRMHLVIFFLVFIFVTAFFMLNLVTAVVVDRTVTAQNEADQSVTKEEVNMRQTRVRFICEMLKRQSSMGLGNASSEGWQNTDLIHLADFEEALKHDEVHEVMRELNWTKHYLRSMFDLTDYNGDDEVSISGLQRLLEVSNEALNTSNYVRFQVNLAHRLEYQESLVLTVLDALNKVGDGKLEIPSSVQESIKKNSLLAKEDVEESPPPQQEHNRFLG